MRISDWSSDVCSSDLLGHDAFYVSNHLNWVDILALGGHGRCAFVAHDGIAGWPIIGWLAEQNHTIFVARESRRHVHLQIEELREALSTHQPIAIFPEGTTGDGATLLPFKPSLLAVMTLPPRAMLVQPLYIDYGRSEEHTSELQSLRHISYDVFSFK